MIFVLVIFVLFCFITANYKNPFSKEYQTDFLSRESTSMINGMFVFLVFLAHFSQYVDDWWKYDSLFIHFFNLLGECVVCSFLFYSGYGMMEQIKKDKNAYLHKLMVKRFPSLWLKFSICVFLYVILAFIMKTDLTVSKVVLSFFGLSSVGNSAWYIFYILFSYVVIYLSFRFINNNKISLSILFLIFIIYTGIIYHVKFDSPAYYLVSFVLPFGILYCLPATWTKTAKLIRCIINERGTPKWQKDDGLRQKKKREWCLKSYRTVKRFQRWQKKTMSIRIS